MILARVATAWAKTPLHPTDPNSTLANVPKIHLDHPGIWWTDSTGQPGANLAPEPNVVLVDIQATEEKMARIRADASCFVLWEE